MQSIKLTVFFDAPFWVGVFECFTGKQVFVSKITFGNEPKDIEIYNFIINQFQKLDFYLVEEKTIRIKKKNPKRMQRDIHKEIQNKGVGTQSQQALKLQYLESKSKCKSQSKKYVLEEKQRKYELKKSKRKEKRRGH